MGFEHVKPCELMTRHTHTWLKRSRQRFPTSQQAWEDIAERTGRTTRSGLTVAHTRYYWRWKVTLYRMKKRQHP